MSLIDTATTYRETKRLPSWAADANVARSSATAFSTNIDAHLDRWIYELLQNAEDAQAGSCRIVLHGNLLVVADSGRGLRVKSVEALSNPFVSDKSGAGVIGRKGVGFSAAYSLSNSPYLISGGEALVFSPARFHNWLNSKPELAELQEVNEDFPYLYALVPFGITKEECHHQLSALDSLDLDGWTRICLPLRQEVTGDQVREKILDPLQALDYAFLLTFSHLRRLRLEHDGEVLLCIDCEETPSLYNAVDCSSFCLRQENATADKQEKTRYTVWDKSVKPPSDLLQEAISDRKTRELMESVSLRILGPLDAGDALKPEPQAVASRLHVYYPTEDSAPLRVALHAEFLVESNRKRLLSPAICRLNAWLLGELADFVVDAAEKCSRAGDWRAALALLQPPAAGLPQDSEAAEVLWRALKDAAGTRLHFTTIEGDPLPLCRLYGLPEIPSALAVQALMQLRKPEKRPVALEITGNSLYGAILESLGCEVVDEEIVLQWLAMPPENLSDTQIQDWLWHAWHVLKDFSERKSLQKEALDILKVLPVDGVMQGRGVELCWKDDGNIEEDLALPCWLPVRFLPTELAKRIKQEGDDSLRKFLASLGIRPFHQQHVLTGLRRAVEKYWQRSEGTAQDAGVFLDYLKNQPWLDEVLDEAFYGVRLGSVPVLVRQDGEVKWVRAREAYFGSDWGNDTLSLILEHYPDTPWLLAEDEDRWRALYRGLGVADYLRLNKPAQEVLSDEFWQRVRNTMPVDFTQKVCRRPKHECKNLDGVKKQLRFFDRVSLSSLTPEKQLALFYMLFTHWRYYQEFRDLSLEYFSHCTRRHLVDNLWWHEFKTTVTLPQSRGVISQNQPLAKCWLGKGYAPKWAGLLFASLDREALAYDRDQQHRVLDWSRENRIVRLDARDTLVREWQVWVQELPRMLHQTDLKKQQKVLRAFYKGFLERLRKNPGGESFESCSPTDTACWKQDDIVVKPGYQVRLVSREDDFNRWRKHIPVLFLDKEDVKGACAALGFILLDRHIFTSLLSKEERMTDNAIKSSVQGILPFLFSYERRCRRRTDIDLQSWHSLECYSAKHILVSLRLDIDGNPEEQEDRFVFGDPSSLEITVREDRRLDAKLVAQGLSDALRFSSDTRKMAELLLLLSGKEEMHRRLRDEDVEVHQIDEDLREFAGESEDELTCPLEAQEASIPQADLSTSVENRVQAEHGEGGSGSGGPAESSHTGTAGRQHASEQQNEQEVAQLVQLREFSAGWEFGTLGDSSATVQLTKGYDDADDTHTGQRNTLPRESTLDHETKLKIEKLSRRFAEAALEKRFPGARIHQKDQLNEGFDIEVELPNRPLRIEVKGHLDTAGVEILTTPELLCANQAGNSYDWELWSVQNLSGEAKAKVQILMFSAVQKSEPKDHRVRLKDCVPVPCSHRNA